MHIQSLIRPFSMVVFVLLFLWTYALFVHVPFAGFDFNSQNGRITRSVQPELLKEGDQLLQVGELTWEAFKHDYNQPLLVNKQPGEVVSLRIRRSEQELSLAWVYPGPTTAQFWVRVRSEWIFAIVFWLVGILTQLFLRPKNERWWLLCLFNFSLALWFAGGSDLSRWHVWGGAVKLRVLTWLFVLVSLHLHWVFPQPLGKIPKFYLWLTYLVGIGIMIGELFQLWPRNMYLLGFFLAVGGSLFFLLLHVKKQPSKRREMALLMTGAALALLPAAGLAYGHMLGSLPLGTELLLFSLPALPLTYLYTAARYQLGEFELRANRLVSLYAFLILLSTASVILVPLVHTIIPTERAIEVTLLAVLLTAILSILGFNQFEHWIERHLLGIPLVKEQLLESYATQITTSLDTTSLIHLLHSQILPSLLVRQAVLLEIDEGGHSIVLGAMGLNEHQLPTDDDLNKLLEVPAYATAHLSWVRVPLQLKIGEQTIGLWLLGRRDPDDFYAAREIATLQAIANQTAIALANITKTKDLRALYQSSIDREESERTRLAHELHDTVLNQLAVLYGRIEKWLPTAQTFHVEETYRKLVNTIRQLIKGLRPAMLSYGLRVALDDLVDNLAKRHPDGPFWEIDFSTEDFRYEPTVEQHLFRIMEQACENVLRHAQAETIWVTSRFTPTRVELIVEDDGIGFEVGEVMDLTYLLTHQHFGLVGMWERAKLIGTVLQIKSTPGKGTRISVTWEE